MAETGATMNDQAQRPSARARVRRVAALGPWLLVLLPGALTVAFGFSSGGFFPGQVAFAALGLGLAFVLRLTLAPRPLEGLSVPYLLGAAALGLFAVWTLASSTWSDASARSLVEYDRALMYLLVFVFFGALGRTPGRLRWLVRGLALGAVAVCVCGLITRVAPDLWHITPRTELDRLGYPVTYRNALGLLAAIGLVLCFGLTSDGREHPVGRVLAAAAMPLLGAATLLTYSRGASGVALIGLAAVALAGRPSALPSAALSALPALAIAVRSAYDADLLATLGPPTAAATQQGHHVARVIALCVAGAACARALLLVLDARLARVSLPQRLRRPAVAWTAATGLVALIVVVAVAVGVPGRVGRQYDRFVNDKNMSASSSRLTVTDPGNNGRIALWDVALDGFRHRTWRGEGAGTFTLVWDRERPPKINEQVEDAHSLYVETLGELGVVGLLLVSAAVLLVLGGFLARARGPDRVVGAALFGAGFAWALHAAIDWDWEMPVVTLWFFAAGAMALSAPRGDGARRSRRGGLSGPLRVGVAAGCLVLLVVPLALYRSQGSLITAARAFAAGDCPAAVDRALASIEALNMRHEPWVVVGYCDVRFGQPRLAVKALDEAVRLDPRNWETHYGLALVRGAAGLDPRAEAGIAHRLAPREPLTADAVRRFDTDDRRVWQRRARSATLPTQ